MVTICIDWISIIQSQSSYFNADRWSQWRDSSINCTDYTPCTIICDEWNSCDSSIINCPSHGRCTVNCKADRSCERATINCPKYSKCAVSCAGEHSCGEITINPPENESLFNFTFTGPSALIDATYPIYRNDNSPLTVNCGYSNVCRQMTIICPKYSQCHVECHADSACIFVCYLH